MASKNSYRQNYHPTISSKNPKNKRSFWITRSSAFPARAKNNVKNYHQRILITKTKGQLISKQNYWAITSQKKNEFVWNLNFDFKFHVFPSRQDRKTNLFVHFFLREVMAMSIWFRDQLTSIIKFGFFEKAPKFEKNLPLKIWRLLKILEL